MTFDLWMLAAAIGWSWTLILVAASPKILADPAWALGNRATTLTRAAWVERAERASENMKENLPLFAGLVLVVHVSGQADDLSALGAGIFMGARVVHAGLYMAGIPGLRTGAWAVSVVGMGMVAAALL